MSIKVRFPTDAYIDFHTHRARQANRQDVVEILSIHPGENKTADWFTLGNHPWLTQQPLSDAELHALETTLTQNSHCLALGECGLDTLKGPALDLQITILEQQLDIANRHGKSVIIHCVRAYDPLIRAKKQFPLIRNWVIHGYARHAILGKSLVDQGFYLSVSPERKSHQGLLTAMATLPLERLFLETDSAPDQDIVAVYDLAAELRGIPLDVLKATLASNCELFFGE